MAKERALSSSNKRTKLLLVALAVAIGLVVLTQVMQRVGKVDAERMVMEANEALARKDMKTAGELLDRVLAFDASNAAALTARGKMWVSIGEFEDAIADWRKVEAIEGDEKSRGWASEARMLEGELQVAMHRAVPAERALLESWELRKRPENLPALELLLRIYVLQMRREETRQVLDVIETFRPLSLEEMILRVDAGAPIVANEEAIVQLREFIAGDPNDLLSVVSLCRYLMSSEKFSEAEAVLDAVPSDVAQQSAIVGLKSLCQFKLGKLNAAIATAAKLSTARRVDYWWWLAAGELAEQASQWELAVECFELASKTQPGSGYAYYRYGLTLQVNGQSEQSKSALATAASIDQLHQQTDAVTRLVNLGPTEYVNGLLQVAKTLRELKSERDCAAWARMALQVDPNNQLARELIAIGTSARSEGDVVKEANSELESQSKLDRVRKWLASVSGAGVQSDSVASAPNASAPNTSPPKFEDVYQQAQLDFQYFNGNSGFKYLIESMGGGVSVLDYNNDGWPDCYFPQGCKFPFDANDFSYLDQLYSNVDGKRFGKVTSQARIVENSYSQGAATGDLNNDGFADVVVANYGLNRVFINQGDGTFVDASDQWGLNESEMSSSLALADFDRDGNLDLYVVNYVDGLGVCRDSNGQVSTCNPQNFAGVQDRLYRSSGDGRFIDVTQESGVVTGDGKGLGVVAADFDDDGWIDIYVANDTNANFLFKNVGGMRFEEMGLASGTALSDEGKAQAGMGIAAGDFDGDLRTDLFVTNFYLESNNLYLNRGMMSFKDEAMKAKLSLPSKRVLGFGTQAEDVDADGDLDLIVANGHIDDYSERGDPWKMPTQLFCNLGDGTFEDQTTSAGAYFQGAYLGRGIASLDWNRDGKTDFVVVHQDRKVALLENRTESQGRLVSLRLVGRNSNRDAIGAKVFGKLSRRDEVRELRGGDGFYASNEGKIRLASAGGDREVRVVWPSGNATFHYINTGVRASILNEK